jgi:hypothetical protein
MTVAPARSSDTPLDARLRDLVGQLSDIERPTASEGERRAAEWVVARFAELGVQARIEQERAHGEYWRPLALLTGAAALAGIAAGRGRRMTGAVVGAAAAAAIWDDLTVGRRVFRRAIARRSAWNVVAETGPAGARRTVVLIAHHDAAHPGLLFHPAIPAFVWKRWPALIERSDTSPPVMFPVFGGPAMVALGSAFGIDPLRRLGTVIAAGTPVVLADIGLRRVVPGANDNATGVVALLEVARALAQRPLADTRVMFVSTSEESILEGMHTFARRHFSSLPARDTFFLNLDTLGSPHLTALRGEGMLKMYDYTPAALDLVDETAAELGIRLFPNLRLRNATDGLVALKGGYPTACIGSVTHYKAPSNYHWPTDTAANVHYDTFADGVRLAEAIVRRLDERWIEPGP